MTTGIIGALEEEVTLLRELLTKKSPPVGQTGMEFLSGELEGKEVVVVHSGIGKVNAALCTQILIDGFGVKRIIFTGVAGGISPLLDIGDIVISSDSLYHDVDVRPFGYPLGELPRLKTRAFPAAPDLIALAEKAVKEGTGETKAFVGRVLTGDRFIAQKEEANRLGQDLGGLCVEMEGAGVGHTCYLNNIPYVLIRSISDQADGTAPRDFRQFCHHAAQRAAQVISNMLKHLE